MITELLIIPVPEEYNGTLRSREIKTNIRNLINGDFLYIDTDTLICGSLEDIDKLPIKNIGMVRDCHCPTIGEGGVTSLKLKKDIKRLFGINISNDGLYYNAGVMLVRDNEQTHLFYTNWHENWLYCTTKGVNTDQQSQAYTYTALVPIVELLPDIYNSQIAWSIKYLYDAKILHFFNIALYSNANSPFIGDIRLYETIRKENCISDHIANKLINIKRSFALSSCVVRREEMDFITSKFYKLYKFNKYAHWLIEKINYWGLYRERRWWEKPKR